MKREREERIRKRKRAEVEAEPRDQAPNVVFCEGDNIEERGMPEANAKQLELSPLVDHRELAPVRAEERREQRMEVEESSNATLIALLQEMKAEIKEREDHNREEMRCRDNNLQELMKKREEDLTVAL